MYDAVVKAAPLGPVAQLARQALGKSRHLVGVAVRDGRGLGRARLAELGEQRADTGLELVELGRDLGDRQPFVGHADQGVKDRGVRVDGAAISALRAKARSSHGMKMR